MIVINQNFFQTFEKQPSIVETVNLKGATDSDMMLADFMKEVPFSIGTDNYKLNVFVADNSDQIILGLISLK